MTSDSSDIRKTHWTVSCFDGDRHSQCNGYVAPLVYSVNRPCQCPCHDTEHPRDYKAAVTRAELSYYGPQGRPPDSTVSYSAPIPRRRTGPATAG